MGPGWRYRFGRAHRGKHCGVTREEKPDRTLANTHVQGVSGGREATKETEKEVSEKRE